MHSVSSTLVAPQPNYRNNRNLSMSMPSMPSSPLTLNIMARPFVPKANDHRPTFRGWPVAKPTSTTTLPVARPYYDASAIVRAADQPASRYITRGKTQSSTRTAASVTPATSTASVGSNTASLAISNDDIWDGWYKMIALSTTDVMNRGDSQSLFAYPSTPFTNPPALSTTTIPTTSPEISSSNTEETVMIHRVNIRPSPFEHGCICGHNFIYRTYDDRPSMDSKFAAKSPVVNIQLRL